MSFIKIEPVRAIKINGKTYRSAHQAALAYSEHAAGQLMYLMYKRGNPAPNVGFAYQQWLKNTRERFYRRSHPIFSRYFKGE